MLLNPDSDAHLWLPDSQRSKQVSITDTKQKNLSGPENDPQRKAAEYDQIRNSKQFLCEICYCPAYFHILVIFY